MQTVQCAAGLHLVGVSGRVPCKQYRIARIVCHFRHVGKMHHALCRLFHCHRAVAKIPDNVCGRNQQQSEDVERKKEFVEEKFCTARELCKTFFVCCHKEKTKDIFRKS